MGLNIRYIRDYFVDSFARKVLIWVVQILATVALAALLSFAFFQTVVIHEGSMEPAISADEKFLVNKVVYQVSNPKRGDIIAFRLGDKEKGSVHIKRVVGLPGDTIQIQNEQILIDGKTYVEQKDFPAIKNAGLAEEPITLASNEYFVLGDNRNSSEDSRFVDIGNIKKDQIVGKLWFAISPVSKLGLLNS
jgi:signal peptidase I, bacterial type